MKQLPFDKIVQCVQDELTRNNKDLLLTEVDEQTIIRIRLQINQIIREHRFSAADRDDATLADAVYSELLEYGFLTPYLKDCEVEEININAYDDVKITYADGSIVPAKGRFKTTGDAIDMIRRMLRVRGDQSLDHSNTLVTTSMEEGQRIAVIGGDNVDPSVGVAASIRIVNPKQLQEHDLIRSGTVTEEMLFLLQTALRYGVSICCTGATGSGKTTFMNHLLNTIPDGKRIFTIEEGVREFQLRRFDRNGNCLNNVVHTMTTRNVKTEDLVVQALTMHPDYLVMAEMKTHEATLRAIEAANTGHTLISTIHASGCWQTYFRIMSLMAGGKNGFDLNLAYALAVNAFPMVIHFKQLEDGSRRITEITEAINYGVGKQELRTLYRFNVRESRWGDTGKPLIYGEFERVNHISPYLQRQLLDNGLPTLLLQELMGGETNDLSANHGLSANGCRDISLTAGLAR